MTARAKKMSRALDVDMEIAEELVKRKLDTPAKVRRATDKELRDVPGIGQVTLGKMRARKSRVTK